jgi:hypothetical protein
MNRALLAELQRQRTYPSITVLVNTTPRRAMSATELASARELAARAERRLAGDVDERLAEWLLRELRALIDAESLSELNAHAIAFCVSPEYAAAVRLGRKVGERVVIDYTFATRDLVADLNRTALYRVVTISERKARLLLGDRARLVEERNATWPMIRDTESASTWARQLAQRLAVEHAELRLPTVIAGVDRTVRRSFVTDALDTIGLLPGNHDRTSWADLHNAAWPLVADWLRADHVRALEALARARSTRRYAGGLDEIWPLAAEGRVDTLVVEEGYAVAARVDGDGRIQRADDPEAPDVIDDIVDELIEAVLLRDGRAVIVGDGALDAHDRVAAVLRY